MGDPHATIPLLVIAGPTAAGKTEAAIQVAQAGGGEIISADSMQIYRGMDIGTAKPTAQQRDQAVFHLIDIVDPDEEYNVACFQKDAEVVISDIYQRGRLPILCGGTGLYIRAVLEHVAVPVGPADKQVRERLQREAAEVGTAGLHERLAQADPVAAARIGPGDRKRIVRALEVYELTGKPMSAQQRVDDSPSARYNRLSFVLCCPRQLLYQRIDQRVDEMMAQGWRAEVQRLREVGYGGGTQAMQAIGYRHLLRYLEEGGDLGGTVREIKRDIRRFAKRQMTWFRHQGDFDWLLWSGERQWRQAVERLTEAGEALAAGSGLH